MDRTFAFVTVCFIAALCFKLWLNHDKEMNGPCHECSECVERRQDNLNIEKE